MTQAVSNLPGRLDVSDSAPAPVSMESTLFQAAKGSGITFAGRLYVYGSRFVIAVVLARLLAAGQYGLFNLGLTAVELFTYLSSLGLATALVRYVAHFKARRDEAGLWGTLQFSFVASMAFSAVFGVILFTLSDPIALGLFHEPRLAPLLQMVSLFVPVFTLSDMAAAATRGFKNMKYTVIAQNFTQPTIRLILIITLAVFVDLNARWALTASGLTELIVAGLLIYFLNMQFSLRRPVHAGRREGRMLLTFSLPVYASNLILRFSGNIRAVLLGMFGAVANVGVFALASQINLLGDMFHSSIVVVAQPIISDLYTRDARKQLARFYQTITKWSLMVNLPFFLILVLFSEPIIALFGKSFAEGAAVLRITAWVGLVDIATGICGVMLDMTDRTRLKLINTIIAVGLSIGVSILLIPAWGLIGAAVSMLASSILINLLRIAEVFILFRMLPYNMEFLKPAIASAATVGAMLLISRLLPPGWDNQVNLAYLIIDCLILLAVYAGATLLLGLSEEDRTIVARLRKRMTARFLRK